MKQRIELARQSDSVGLVKPSVPRNKLLKNKIDHSKQVRQQVESLKNICNEHALGDLSLIDCKFATEAGSQIILENSVVWGNMRASAIVIATKNIDEINDIYDAIELKNNKRERDQKKKEADDAVAMVELERLKMADLPVENPGHQAIMKQLNEKSSAIDTTVNTTFDVSTDTGTDVSTDTTTDVSTDTTTDLATGESAVIPIDNTDEDIKKEITLTKSQRKRMKALRAMNTELQKKAKMSHNKYHRNFMTKLTSKFTINPIREYYYFEAKMNITCMIISDVKAYRIVMPENTPHQYFLITGDLQLKTKLMSEIDPAYNASNKQSDYDDFMKRIADKEKIKQASYPGDELVDEESDEDSDEETDQKTNADVKIKPDEISILGMADDGLVNMPHTENNQ